MARENSVVTIGPDDGCIIVRADGTREMLVPHPDDENEPVSQVALDVLYMSVLHKYPDILSQLQARVHLLIALEGEKEESDGENQASE